jgi:lysophospholipase L1-like esterase
MKPLHTLLFLAGVFGLCALTMAVFPEDGFTIGSTKLEFETWEGFMAEEESTAPAFDNLEDFLSQYESPVDSLALLDSLAQIEIEKRKELLHIQYAEGDEDILFPFFKALSTEKDKKHRVVHYGDSQIEGDRITGHVRNELQKEFGGSGPGLLQPFEVIPTIAIDQSHSANWSRATVYGRKDTTVHHKRYGLMAHFNRYVVDSAKTDSSADAWLRYKPSRLTYSTGKQYSRAKMFLGHNTKSFELVVKVDDVVLTRETILPKNASYTRSWKFASTPSDLVFEFYGDGGPEVYGVTLEGSTGVNVDNIALRGCSGTIFTKIDKGQLDSQLDELNVKLFILQFGGNMVPYISSKEKADECGRWFISQVNRLRELVPDACFIVIGPSDMAEKVKDDYVTRPYLVEVRDALKAAAFETNCGYWDIYEVMGGKNSMQSWVDAEPPLAGKDYTHFTPAGAKRMAELFCKALWHDYDAWKASQP